MGEFWFNSRVVWQSPTGLEIKSPGSRVGQSLAGAIVGVWGSKGSGGRSSEFRSRQLPGWMMLVELCHLGQVLGIMVGLGC